jgi:predicted transposase YbfD/YdcC
MTVKGNQPGLKRRIANLPWDVTPASTETDLGHGRKVTRTHQLLRAPNLIGFPEAIQAAKVRRTRTIEGKTSWEEVYIITNHPTATHSQLASWTQRHWAIENELHWERDVVWQEDKSQVRTGTRPRAMATLHNTALTILGLAGVNEISRTLTYLWAKPQVTTALVGL